MAITDSIKQILSVKIKPRHDSYSDQFSRIFMMKLMMIGALLGGLSWYSDKISCIIPKGAEIDGSFVAQACWINGLYVYEDIRYHENEIGYYGIPRDISNDGMDKDGDLCKQKNSQKCRSMKKTFFLQYQYLTFIFPALAALFYAPYSIFRFINQDIVSLKGTIIAKKPDGSKKPDENANDNNDDTKKEESKADAIVKAYFNYKVNSRTKMRLRVLGNIIVKITYIVSNVLVFIITDMILNGQYISYGLRWTQWLNMPNYLAHDYMGLRLSPKPGNVLLPSFAFCEVQDSSKDIKTLVNNKHRFVCELSQHILYQYLFIITWFCMIFGMIFSVIGFLILLTEHIITLACFLKGGSSARKMYNEMTLRECQYLEYIRRKDMVLFSEVIQKINESRFNEQDARPIFRGPNSYEMS